MNHFPLEYTLNYFQLASNNAVFKQTCQHNFQLVDYAFISWRLISLLLPCYGNHSSKRINRFNPNFCFFQKQTSGFSLLGHQEGYRPVVAGRHSLREVRYQLAMLRRKRNRHSSPSVRPTTLAPPVHQLALKFFLKMPYILSDLGPIIVFSHWLCPVVCSSLNDGTWLMNIGV